MISRYCAVVFLMVALSIGAQPQQGTQMTGINSVKFIWGNMPSGAPATFLFTFDPVFGLKDINGQQIGIDGWKFLAAPDAQTSAYLKVERGVTLEQAYRAIARLKDEGHFRSVVITFDIP